MVSAAWFRDAILRVSDVVAASIGILLLWPIMLVVAVILRATGEGTVLFVQERIGRGEHAFRLFKFATMVKGAAGMGAGVITLPGDARVLPFGKFLRKTKLDELPQLFNVLNGDTSLVGPRPQPAQYYYAYDAETRTAIAQVRPGITGIGSLLFRNEEALFCMVADPVAFDHEAIVPYKGALERWYVENRSVSLYWRLVLATMLSVVLPRFSAYRIFQSRVPAMPARLRNVYLSKR